MARFGRQRSPGDYLSIVALLAGFCGLAMAYRVYTDTWLGLLLPAGYVIGLAAALRTEVRELVIEDRRLLVRTFFGTYPMPREHVVRILHTPRGPAVEVLNGNRYAVTPYGADRTVVAAALEEWMAGTV